MKMNDVKFLRIAIETAQKARDNGNHPFGAILVDDQEDILLKVENSVTSDKDVTAHAELSLVRQASKEFDPDFLSRCTLYASTEPCPMCSGAIYWGNIGRVVYGLSEEGLYKMINPDSTEKLLLSCKEVLSLGEKEIEVIGPLIEDEAAKVHFGFWE